MLSLLSIVVLVQVLLYYYATPLLKTYLQRSVAAQSGGYYAIDFDALRINLSARSLTISQFHLYPDTAVVDHLPDSARQDASLYEVHIPTLELNNLRAYQYYQHRIISFKQVLVKGPEVNVIGVPQRANPSHDNLIRTLYELVPETIQRLQVDRLELVNGDFGLFTGDTLAEQLSKAEELTIALKNFRIDSAALFNPSRIFYSDDIEFRLRNFGLELADNLHRMHAGEVSISKQTGVVRVENFHLAADPPAAAGQIDPRMRLYVTVPQFELQLKNLDQAYFKRVVNIDHVHWRTPTIRCYRPTTSDAPAMPEQSLDSLSFELYPLVANYLQSLTIDTLSIGEGKFELYRDNLAHPDSLPRLQVDNLTLALRHFRIDATASRDTSLIFNAQDFELTLNNFLLGLSDKRHQVRAESVKVSTITSEIQAQRVSVRPLPSIRGPFRETTELYRIQVPEVHMNSVDLHRLYHAGELTMALLSVAQASADLSRHGPTRIDTVDASPRLYTLIAEEVNLVEVDTLRLRRGTVQLARYWGTQNDTLSAGQVSFDLFHFRLDSTTLYRDDRVFYADDLEFRLADYSLRLSDNIHQFRAAQVGISTLRSEVYARDIRIFPTDGGSLSHRLERRQQNATFDVLVPEVRVRGADIRRAYFQRRLRIGDIEVTDPHLELTRFAGMNKNRTQDHERLDLYSLISDYLWSIEVNKMRLLNGELTFQVQKEGETNILFQHEVSAEMTRFYLDAQADQSDRLFYADDIDVLIRDYTLFLPDSLHQVKAGQLVLSTGRSEIVASEVQLFPAAQESYGEDVRRLYRVQMPQIRMSQVDLKRLYEDNKLYVTGLTLAEPTIEIAWLPAATERKKKVRSIERQRAPTMPRSLREVHVQQVRVEKGKLVVSQQEADGRSNEFSSASVDLSLRNFDLDDQRLRSQSLLGLLSNNLNVQLQQYTWKLPDSLHVLQAGSIRFIANEEKVELGDVHLAPRPPRSRPATLGAKKPMRFFHVDCPTISLEGIDPAQMVEGASLQLRSILLRGPRIRIDDYAPPKKTKPAKEVDPYELIRSTFRDVSVERIHFMRGDISYQRLRRGKDNPIRLERLSGQIQGFRLDSASYRDTRPFYADDVRMKLENYRREDSLRFFQAGEIGFSTAEQKIWLHQVESAPFADQPTFAQQVDNQKDYVRWKADRMEVDRFQFDTWLDDGSIRASDVHVKGLALTDFRDKSMPRDEHYKPMPREMLQRIRATVAFDTVRLSEAHLTYEELAPEGQKPGRIDFTRGNIRLFNVTNDPERIQQHPVIEARIDMLVMDQGHLIGTLRCRLDDPTDPFTLRGRMTSLSLSKLNPLLEPVAFVVIESGVAEQVDFDIKGNREFAEGDMHFRYNDLKISLANKRTGDTNKLGVEIASFFANAFVLRSRNPRVPFGPLHPGEVYMERDKNKSFVNYCWKALLSGIKTSIGMSAVKKKDRNYHVAEQVDE
ncbi:hypothetical protein [Catalinimonas alkaloidigena]|uniref:hypothetical protein n=1 Tax=Catalinimonas alkaloidigena TaxID=1075417 RepID=UPI000B80109D|nr:hypothetical protein [Catalinimonas alkaloidigena]